MDDIAVRRAGPGDAAAVATLNRHVHDLHVQAEPEHFHATDGAEVESFFRQVIASAENVVLVAMGDQPLGYVWAQDVVRARSAFTNQSRVMYIHHLAVAPAVRRTGVATSLCRAVEAEAQRRGIRDLALDHWAFNRDAAEFFGRHGYVDFNVRMRKRLPGE